jgi:predicted nucleic acid-binding protein
MLVLDTNVVSALMHEAPPPSVMQWLDRQPRISVWTTSVTLMEVRYGIEALGRGRRRNRLLHAMQRLIDEKIEHRIAAFDAEAATAAALLMAERRRTGHTGEMRDTMIAGIVIASHATLATHNVRHFSDLPVPVVNPWEAKGQ